MTAELEHQIATYVQWLVDDTDSDQTRPTPSTPRPSISVGILVAAAALLVVGVGVWQLLGRETGPEVLVAAAPPTSAVATTTAMPARAVAASVRELGDVRIFEVTWDDGRREEFARIEWRWDVLMPVAAPNGAAVVFVAVRGMAVDLYAMDRDRPMPRNLTLEIFDVQSEPLVSPNSELVAMERSGGGVHLIPLDEELEIVTIEAEGLVSELEWTSEGTIRFIAGADAARQQFEYDITGSLVRRGPAGGGES